MRYRALSPAQKFLRGTLDHLFVDAPSDLIYLIESTDSEDVPSLLRNMIGQEIREQDLVRTVDLWRSLC